MPKKTTVVASSLSLCTATFFVGGESSNVFADTLMKPNAPDWEKEQIAQEVLYQYLNPISSVTEGQLAVKTEVKPLTYEIETGDTLYAIGEKYGVSHQRLAKLNKIRNPQSLMPGQKLKIPVQMQRIRVKEGQTLKSIAGKYRTTVHALKEANPEVDLSGSLYVGQVLTVPRVLSIPRQAKSSKHRVQLASSTQVKASSEARAFRWPVTGQITSGYGWRNGRMHTGIDIWNEQRENAVIRASLGGVVIRSGYAGGYGNLVVVDHGDGWSTYYAHLSRITVSKGQTVASGRSLGSMGTTGNSTGVHLHFEVRRNDQPINPLSVLP